MINNTRLINFRIPNHLDQRFHNLCKYRHLTRSSVINNLMEEWILTNEKIYQSKPTPSDMDDRSIFLSYWCVMFSKSPFRTSQIDEGTYPSWLKVITFGLVSKIQSLQNKIEQTDDLSTQIKLLSKQNTNLSYLIGLSIGIDSDDPKLMNRIKGRVKRWFMLSQTIKPKTKNDLIKSIRNQTIKEFNIHEVSNLVDMKDLTRSVNSMLKKGSVYIVVII